jgi:two-component system sensor histidine kinase/response regulator
MKHTLMFIDDETDNLDALERVFRKKYNVIKCSSGPDALEILKEQENVSVIISDQRMPEMTGVQFLEKSMKLHPNAIRILLTGYTDLDSVIAAINSGQVYRYITKPWDTRDLQITVDQAVEKFELESELKVKNQKLEKALNELKTLDQAKSQFMILINHELKTPLTTLLSFMELLEQSKLDADQTKYVKRVNQSSARLHEIIADSLELVSSELEQVKVQKSKIQDKKIIDQALKKLSPVIDEKKVKIKTILCEESFESDSQMLENILVRVIKNAIQHGDDSEPITITTSLDENEKIKFEITNFGKDISKDTIDKILKPFALNENIMNHTKGLGLGLSISQSLLKRLGSTLGIESSKKQITVSFSI